MLVLSRHCNDGLNFRPVSQCRTLDFTVGFENSFLSILPNALFAILWIALRFPHVRRKPVQSTVWTADSLLVARTAFAALTCCLSLAVLAITGHLADNDSDTYHSIGASTFLAASSVEFATLSIFTVATWFERRHTVGGHWLLPTWLLLIILFDAARLRTFALIGLFSTQVVVFATFAACLACRVCSFVLESINTVEQTYRGRSQPLPRERTSTFVDRLGFFWLFSLLGRGIRASITLDTLDSLPRSFSPRLLKAQLDRHWNAGHNSPPPRNSGWFTSVRRTNALVVALLRSFLPDLIIKPLVPRIILTAAQLAVPFLVSDTIDFIQSYTHTTEPTAPGQAQPAPVGWALAASFGLLFFVIAVSTGQFLSLICQANTKLRGALVTSILEKCLALDFGRASKLGSTGATNLLGVDVERVVFCIAILHLTWSGIVTIGVGSYILWLQIGSTFLAPLITTIVLLCVLPLLNRGIGDRQKAWSNQTDRRLKLTLSTLRAIQAVKMMAWEPLAIDRILAARTEEITAMKHYFWRLSHVVATTNLTGDMLMFVTFATYAIVLKFSTSSTLADFNTRTIFTSLTTLSLMTGPLFSIGQNLAVLLSSLASLQRIQTFLEEQQAPDNLLTQPNEQRSSTAVLTAVEIRFDTVHVGWLSKNARTLGGISLAFPPGKLSTVSGPASCGKTTLLLAILGELPLSSGTIHFDQMVNPSTRAALIRRDLRFGYADQAAWLQETESVRDNIVLHSAQVDESWYNTCLEACALVEDVAQWAQGDNRRAKHLSGGQKQRVALCRALYASPNLDAILLDDTFSSLDANVEKHILNKLFHQHTGLLPGKTTVLVTNAAHIVHSRSHFHVVLSEDGKVESAESPSRLIDSFASRLAVGDEALVSSASGTDIIARAQGLIQDIAQVEGKNVKNTADSVKEAIEQDEEVVSHSPIRFSTYKLWLEKAGYWRAAIVLFFNATIYACTLGGQVVLQKWAEANEKRPGHDFAGWIVGYASLVLGTCISFVVFYYSFQLWVVVRASDRIHRAEITSVLNAPFTFFQLNPLGRVLNRFSQDLFIIDWDWPMQSTNLTSNLLALLGSLVVMVISMPYLLIILAPLIVLSWLLRKFYIPSSRQLRRLEMAAKSPLYTCCGDVVAGIAVLRAVGAHQELMDTAILDLIDRSQRPFYYVFTVRCWLRVYLNIVVLLINLSLVLLCVGLRTTSLVSLIGVALSQTVSLSDMINSTITAWTEAEIAAVALERVNELIQLPQETDDSVAPIVHIEEDQLSRRRDAGCNNGNRTLLDTAFELRHFWAWYGDEKGGQTQADGDAVLTDINLSIARGSYTCVCGRSGSGKSTLLLAITRMLARTRGELLVFGESITSMRAHDLRSRMIVLPQEPFLLHGASVRSNLDVAALSTDDALLWQALSSVGLESCFQSLDEQMHATRLTPSQSQLFAIARALVISTTNDRVQVVLLDEVNSSLSEQADKCIQNLLRTKMRHLTVISVVHRLDQIDKADMVIVLDSGAVAEYDAPSALLSNPSSKLYKLVRARHSHQACAD